MKTIAPAFLKAQQEMSNASKGSSNPFFKSKYADLNSIREAVLPPLHAHGISVIQPTITIDGKNYVNTILLHESGETIESLTEILFTKQNDAQAQGSGITYARRYGLQSLVCIGAADDDGNKASTPPTQPAPKKKTPVTMTTELVNEITNCTSLTALQRIWDTNGALHKDQSFVDLKNAKKEALNGQHN